MKIVKFIASFLIVFGIFALLIWTGVKTNNKTCTDISITIHSSDKSELLSKSDILNILKQNNSEWQGKIIKEIDLASIRQILAKESYVKSVDKVHFLSTKLQIEVTLYDILMVVETQNGQKFLLDRNGIYLPYSPNTGNDVIFASGAIPYTFHKKETITLENKVLYDIFTLSTLVKKDRLYADLYKKLSVNSKHEIILHPTVGKLPVLFGTVQDAEQKLKTLMYMFNEVIPYMDENRYAQLDVRFTNRIVATKNRS